MEVLIPFHNVEDLDFYRHLVRSIQSTGVDITIAYVRGEPKEEWGLKSVSFVKLPESITKTSSLLLHSSRISEALSQVKPNVTFVLSELWSLAFAYVLRRSRKVPFVVWLRGDHRRVRKLRGTSTPVRIAANTLETFLLNRAALIVPNSLRIQRATLSWGIDKRKVTQPVYNGVDTEFFKPLETHKSNKFIVGYAGRFAAEKRVEKLIEIAKEIPQVKFLMTCSKPENISLPSNVVCLGRLKFNHMPMFYSSIDLLALPSATESFPSVILEAYACERPVLATPEAFPEELKIFGAVAPITEFREKILTLKELDLKTLGKEARVYVSKYFSWNVFAEHMRDYLEKALRG